MRNEILLITWLSIFIGVSIYWGFHLNDSSIKYDKLAEGSTLVNSQKYKYFNGSLKGNYRGRWYYLNHTFETNENSLSNHFNQGGIIEYKGGATSQIQVIIYDGNYSDNSAYYKLSSNPEIVFTDNESQNTSQYSEMEFHLSIQEKMSVGAPQVCNMDFYLEKNTNNTLSLCMTMGTNSRKCSIEFSAVLIKESEYSKNLKILIYQIVVFINLYISSLGSILQIKRLKINSIRSYKLSLLPPTLLLISNLSWLVYHLLLDIGDTSQFFPLIYLHHIFSIVFFQYQLLAEIWKTRYEYKLQSNLISADISIQKYCTSKKVKLVLQFIIVLLFSQIIFVYHYLLLALCACLWVPQIARAYKLKGGKAPHPLYVVSSTLTFIALPLYFRGYRFNFQDYSYSMLYAILQFSISSIICVIVLLQVKFRYNIFVPRCCIMPVEQTYNYYANEKLTNGQICPICFIEIKPSQSNELVYMKTPCNHYFHKECLEQWLKQKLECPTCRRALPKVSIDEGE